MKYASLRHALLLCGSIALNAMLLHVVLVQGAALWGR